jgi:hypothetical protein
MIGDWAQEGKLTRQRSSTFCVVLKKYKNKKSQQLLRLVPAVAALYYGQLAVPNFVPPS